MDTLREISLHLSTAEKDVSKSVAKLAMIGKIRVLTCSNSFRSKATPKHTQIYKKQYHPHEKLMWRNEPKCGLP